MSKRILTLLLSVMIMCSLALVPAEAASAGAATYQFSESEELIKTVGRTVLNENGLYVSWSNSGIAFTGSMEGEVKMKIYSSSNYMDLAVVVDGGYNVPNRFAIYSGEQEYVIADVEKGEHTIELFKLSEAAWGYFIFEELTINGELRQKPADKELQIEIIGDSLTCGFGIYPSGGKADYPVFPGKSIEEEDSYYTYAALVARRLNADASFVSLSGWGVTQGGDGDETHLIPPIYRQVCGVTHECCQTEWDFENHPVDVVICSLGTNDWLMWSKGGEAKLKTGIVDFCKTIRKCYPEATIVWTYGLMHTLMEDTIRSAVESVKDADLYYCSMPTNTSGGASHADYWGHEAAAQKLYTDLKKLGIG